MEYSLDARKVRNFLFLVIAFLLSAHVANRLCVPLLGHGFPIVDLDSEMNVPTLFSTLLLFSSACLFWMIARLNQQKGISGLFYWYGLSAVFLFLAVDEFSEIHERVTYLLKQNYETHGLFYSIWIVPYGIVVLVLFRIYLRFLLRLPATFRYRLIFAGILYVSGAIGVEAIGEWLSELKLEHTFAFIACVTIEEVLEMSGAVILIHGLLCYISTEFPNLSIAIKDS